MAGVAPNELRELTRPGGEYETYYSSHPAASFAAQVWTNNAWAAAQCLILGVFLGLSNLSQGVLPALEDMTGITLATGARTVAQVDLLDEDLL